MKTPRHLPLPALALLVTAAGVTAQETEAPVDLAALTCKEVMIHGGESRATAISFLQGWVAGKMGRTSLGSEEMVAEAEAFLDACLDNPTAGALATMEAVATK